MGEQGLDSTPLPPLSRTQNILPSLRLDVNTRGQSVLRLSHSQPSSPPAGSYHPTLDQTIFSSVDDSGRPPSTPPLPVRALQLVAKQPETPVVLRDGRKVRGHGSGVRESWPGTGLTTFDPNPRMSQRSVTPPSRAQPVTEVQTRTSNQSRLRAPPRPPDQNPLLPSGWSSEATMMSLLLFCHSTSSHSLVALDNRIEQVLDLVKSHLMLAVREEVELLRERIRELQEKNQHLERENHILRTLTHNIHTT